MVRGTGIFFKFDSSLLWMAAILAIIGPRWIMNVFRVSWQVAIGATIVFTLVLLIGVLVHEIGHAVAARWSGIDVLGITVSWWGGATSLGPSTFQSSALVALSGPVVNGVFAAGVFFVGNLCTSIPVLDIGFQLGAWINLFLTVFNLLPFAPLDGSHMVSDLVSLATGSREKGERTVAWVGIALIPLLFAWFLVRGSLRSWIDLAILVLVLLLIWKFSFDKLKRVDASHASENFVRFLSRPVEQVAKGTPVGLVSGTQDVVVIDGFGKPLGFVPADLVNMSRQAASELAIEQLSSALPSYRVSSDLKPLDINEFAQGHYLVLTQRELGKDVSPSWLVEEGGRIVGILHYRDYLAHMAG